MGTFSEQLLEKQKERMQIDVTKLPRTERKQYQIAKKEAEIRASQELERRKNLFAETKSKVSSMSLTEYKTFYPQMEDWLKEMFTSPEAIETKQKEEIATNVSKADTQIKKYQDRLANKEKQIQEMYEWWRSQSSKAKNRAGAKESFRERIADKEKDLEEYKNYIQYWEQAKGSYLSQGIDYGDVYDWVSSKVEYRVAKSEAKASARKDEGSRVSTTIASGVVSIPYSWTSRRQNARRRQESIESTARATSRAKETETRRTKNS